MSLLTINKNLKKVTFAFIALIAVMVMLNGCRKQKESEISEYDKTLEGIDADHNGIRDEIEKRMHAEFKDSITYEEQKVLDLHARAYDEMLHVDLNDRQMVLLIRDHLDMAINCGVLVFGDEMRYHNLSINLTRLTQWYFNTKERKERKKEFILRTKEYHYVPTNFDGANTCDFEFSPELVKELERRKIAKEEEAKKLKEIEERKAKEEEANK